MQEQNFKNHSRLVPLFHFVTFSLILAIIVVGIYKFYLNYTTGWGGGLIIPGLFIAIGVSLGLVAWFARAFAIKAQDRAIRAEENLRYFAITGKLLDDKLRIAQIVALRFAANNEFVELAHRAVKEDMSAKEIKMAIKNWKADHHRA
ncbi:MAG: DUF6526 family protein [Ferruginibacter sp.]